MLFIFRHAVLVDYEAKGGNNLISLVIRQIEYLALDCIEATAYISISAISGIE